MTNYSSYLTVAAVDPSSHVGVYWVEIMGLTAQKTKIYTPFMHVCYIVGMSMCDIMLMSSPGGSVLIIYDSQVQKIVLF